MIPTGNFRRVPQRKKPLAHVDIRGLHGSGLQGGKTDQGFENRSRHIALHGPIQQRPGLGIVAQGIVVHRIESGGIHFRQIEGRLRRHGQNRPGMHVHHHHGPAAMVRFVRQQIPGNQLGLQIQRQMQIVPVARQNRRTDIAVDIPQGADAHQTRSRHPGKLRIIRLLQPRPTMQFRAHIRPRITIHLARRSRAFAPRVSQEMTGTARIVVMPLDPGRQFQAGKRRKSFRQQGQLPSVEVAKNRHRQGRTHPQMTLESGYGQRHGAAQQASQFPGLLHHMFDGGRTGTGLAHLRQMINRIGHPPVTDQFLSARSQNPPANRIQTYGANALSQRGASMLAALLHLNMPETQDQ